MDPLTFIAGYLSDNEQGMKNLIAWFLNHIMLQEALLQAGANPYERTEVRKAHRNGFYTRSLKTRYGETVLKILQFRDILFETQMFWRYSRVEKALMNAIAESYLQGVSTRKVQEIVAHLGPEQLSPALVSRMAKDLEKQVRKHPKEIPDSLKEAYGDEKGLQNLADDLNAHGYRKPTNIIERFLPGLMSYTAFPKQHWKRIRTTNMMGRVNKELKRRSKVVRAFPNEKSPLRLVGSILMDVNEE